MSYSRKGKLAAATGEPAAAPDQQEPGCEAATIKRKKLGRPPKSPAGSGLIFLLFKYISLS